VAVADAETSAQIHVVETDPGGAQSVDELEHLVERRDERLHIGDLRADVRVDSGDANARQLRRPSVKWNGRVVRDSELALAQAGGNVRMRLGIDVGVDAQRYGRDLPCARCERSEAIQLRL